MRFSLMTLLCLLAGSAQAVEFNQIVPAQSRISFGYKQMGAPMDGKFGQFNVQMRFDPANLKTASARMDVNPPASTPVRAKPTTKWRAKCGLTAAPFRMGSSFRPASKP